MRHCHRGIYFLAPWSHSSYLVKICSCQWYFQCLQGDHPLAAFQMSSSAVLVKAEAAVPDE